MIDTRERMADPVAEELKEKRAAKRLHGKVIACTQCGRVGMSSCQSSPTRHYRICRPTAIWDEIASVVNS